MDTQEVNKAVEAQISKAQAQPGIAEIARIYGRYDELMRHSRIYLEGINPLKTE